MNTKIIYQHSTTLGMRGNKRNHEPLTQKDIDACEQQAGGQWRYMRADGSLVKLDETKSHAWVTMLVGNYMTNNQYTDFYELQ